MGHWKHNNLLQLPIILALSLSIILTYNIPQTQSQSFFPSRKQCLRFPRSSILCSFLPVPIHYTRPRPHPPHRPPLGFQRPFTQIRRPPPTRFIRGRPPIPPRNNKAPLPAVDSGEESMEHTIQNSDKREDLINPLARRPHPMVMEMEHVLSLPVSFTNVHMKTTRPTFIRNKKRPNKVKWRISETNTIEKEMDHLSRLMSWQPKSRSKSTTTPTPTTSRTPIVMNSSTSRQSEMTSTTSPTVPTLSGDPSSPLKTHKKRPGNSWMKETMEEMPTVMKTIPLMTTFAKAALILNRKSKQDQEEQQQKQQQQFNNNRPDFFSYTNAFLLFSKDAMGPVRASERKKPKKKKKAGAEQLPELTKEELLEEQRRKKEQEKSEKIRKSIERLHLTRAIIGVVSDSLNLASNKINLINTVAGSSLIGGGNNNPGGGGGGGGGGILNAAKNRVKLHTQKFTSLIKAAASAGAPGTEVISGILGKNPILQLPFQARTNLTDAVDSYATLVTREAIHNATLSEL